MKTLYLFFSLIKIPKIVGARAPPTPSPIEKKMANAWLLICFKNKFARNIKL